MTNDQSSGGIPEDHTVRCGRSYVHVETGDVADVIATTRSLVIFRVRNTATVRISWGSDFRREHRLNGR